MAYSKGKIYRLVCNTTGNQYIGSTVQSLSQRLGNHKALYKRFIEGKITKKSTSFSILSENNFEMILIEEFACENKNQLERRERHFIETMECVNKNKPAQTREELLEYQRQYAKDHQEERAKSQRDYYQKHKEEYIEYHQQYRKDHKEESTTLTRCECGGQYQHKHKSEHFKSIKHTSYLTNE